jgi:hypothetical protein
MGGWREETAGFVSVGDSQQLFPQSVQFLGVIDLPLFCWRSMSGFVNLTNFLRIWLAGGSSWRWVTILLLFKNDGPSLFVRSSIRRFNGQLLWPKPFPLPSPFHF